MRSGLEVRDKKAIYLNGHQLISDTFDYAYEYKGYLIAYNSNHLVIISPNGDLLVSEEGTVWQVYNYGEYISIRKDDDVMGVYRYDGLLVVPFEFYAVFICFDKKFEVMKNKGDEFIPYELK